MADKEKNVAEVEKTKKPAKPAKEKKTGKIKDFWHGFRSEVKKVVWPSWKQVAKNTGIVLAVMAVFAIMIGALDYAFLKGLSALSELFG